MDGSFRCGQVWSGVGNNGVGIIGQGCQVVRQGEQRGAARCGEQWGFAARCPLRPGACLPACTANGGYRERGSR